MDYNKLVEHHSRLNGHNFIFDAKFMIIEWIEKNASDNISAIIER